MPHPSIARQIILGAALGVCIASPLLAQPGEGERGEGGGRRGDRRGPSTYIRNARVLTMAGPALENATIHITGSTIRQIAGGSGIEIPDGATVVDGMGLTVTPGLIDADGTLGMSYASRGGSPEPTNRAFDAFDRYAIDVFKDAVRNGVTALSISPRNGTGITGTSAVIRLQPGPDGPWAGAVVKEDAALCIDLNSGAPATQRLETLDRVRRQFRAAIDYRDALDTYKEELEAYEKKIKERADKEKAEKDKAGEKKPEAGAGSTQPPKEGAGAEKKEDEIKKPAEPTPDRKSEVLLKAIDRQLPVRVRCERSEDILNALELAKEFSLDLTIDGGAEAHLLAPQIAKAKADVVLGTALSSAFFRNDPFHRRSAGSLDALTHAGIACVVGSGRGGGVDDGIGDPSATRFILANAQLVAQNSEGNVDPLKLVTADAAEFLGVADKIGRLRPGMPADIVLWSGDPLDPSARVREVYIGGELVYRNESTTGEGAKR